MSGGSGGAGRAGRNGVETLLILTQNKAQNAGDHDLPRRQNTVPRIRRKSPPLASNLRCPASSTALRHWGMRAKKCLFWERVKVHSKTVPSSSARNPNFFDFAFRKRLIQSLRPTLFFQKKTAPPLDARLRFLEKSPPPRPRLCPRKPSAARCKRVEKCFSTPLRRATNPFFAPSRSVKLERVAARHRRPMSR